MKLKIKSSSRIKKRYILIETNKKENIEKAILDYIGILGFSKAAPVFVEPFNKINSNNFILSVDRKELQNVRAAFELSQDKIKVLRVSGMLKGLLKA